MDILKKIDLNNLGFTSIIGYLEYKSKRLKVIEYDDSTFVKAFIKDVNLRNTSSMFIDLKIADNIYLTDMELLRKVEKYTLIKSVSNKEYLLGSWNVELNENLTSLFHYALHFDIDPSSYKGVILKD